MKSEANHSKINKYNIVLFISIPANMNVSSKALLLHEVTVILLLVFGLMLTVALFVLIHYYCRKSGKRGRKLKNYAVDADYLINGLYL